MLKRQLKLAGFEFEVFEKSDGSTALEFLKQYESNAENYPEAFPPILIFLDINMPKVTGPEFLEEFKVIRRGRYEDSCVIMMFTSSERQEDREKVMQFEFVKDYFVKGAYDIKELKKRVSSTVSL